MTAAAGGIIPWGVGLACLASGLLFVLALRGLSSVEAARVPASRQRVCRYGMAGMALAIGTTLYTQNAASLPEIGIAILVGAGIGMLAAQRIAIAAIPQGVAAFHSLAGLAAVTVGIAAYLDPGAVGILDFGAGVATGGDAATLGEIIPVGRLGLCLGLAFGAVSVSGSIATFLKLNGKMAGGPMPPPAHPLITLGMLAVMLGLMGWFCAMPAPSEAPWPLWAILVLSLAFGFLHVLPIGRVDMPVLLSMLNSSSGWAAAAMGFMSNNMALVMAGGLVGASGAALSHRLCRATNRSLLSVLGGAPVTEGAVRGL